LRCETASSNWRFRCISCLFFFLVHGQTLGLKRSNAPVVRLRLRALCAVKAACTTLSQSNAWRPRSVHKCVPTRTR
jgi:hypothetical protein